MRNKETHCRLRGLGLEGDLVCKSPETERNSGLEKQKEGGEWQKRDENSRNKHVLSNATERVRTKRGHWTN